MKETTIHINNNFLNTQEYQMGQPIRLIIKWKIHLRETLIICSSKRQLIVGREWVWIREEGQRNCRETRTRCQGNNTIECHQALSILSQSRSSRMPTTKRPNMTNLFTKEQATNKTQASTNPQKLTTNAYNNNFNYG